MIIREEVGDLFECKSQTITCPINTVGAMGKGLALQFRNRVDGLYRWYQSHYPPIMGSSGDKRANYIQVFPVPDGRQVLLFPTKTDWRKPSTVEQIQTNLEKLAQNYEQWNIQSLALPALGCGEGGLAYDRDIRPLLFRYLDPLPLPVEVLFRYQTTTRY